MKFFDPTRTYVVYRKATPRDFVGTWDIWEFANELTATQIARYLNITRDKLLLHENYKQVWLVATLKEYMEIYPDAGMCSVCPPPYWFLSTVQNHLDVLDRFLAEWNTIANDEWITPKEVFHSLHQPETV